jgi:hypothetical protein
LFPNNGIFLSSGRESREQGIKSRSLSGGEGRLISACCPKLTGRIAFDLARPTLLMEIGITAFSQGTYFIPLAVCILVELAFQP